MNRFVFPPEVVHAVQRVSRGPRRLTYSGWRALSRWLVRDEENALWAVLTHIGYGYFEPVYQPLRDDTLCGSCLLSRSEEALDLLESLDFSVMLDVARASAGHSDPWVPEARFLAALRNEIADPRTTPRARALLQRIEVETMLFTLRL